MQLLLPESGLLFWMLISFGIVVFVLARYGFPAIIKMVEERKKYIDESLVAAKQAFDQLADIKVQSEAVMGEARQEQARILKDASQMRDQLIKEAKEKALVEANKIIDDARKQISAEKNDAIREIRSMVATLSVDIAEKVIRNQLDKKEKQMEMIDRLLNEMDVPKS